MDRPYSWRVWLALEFKGVAYNLKVLSFSDKDTTKPEFVAINPRHTVPTIVDDGYALWESMAILEYLDERFPNAAKLYPGRCQRNRARIRRLMREMEYYVIAEGVDKIVDELFWKEGGDADMAKVAKWREQGARGTRLFREGAARQVHCGRCAHGGGLRPLSVPCLLLAHQRAQARCGIGRRRSARARRLQEAHRGAAVLRQDLPARTGDEMRFTVRATDGERAARHADARARRGRRRRPSCRWAPTAP